VKRDEVLEALERERSRLFSAVDALGEHAESAAVTAEGWTAKDVLSHCIHWAGQMAFGMGAKVEPPAYLLGVEGRPSEEEWNAMAVKHYRPLPLSEVRGELLRVAGLVESEVRRRDDSAMLATNAIPWSPGKPLWQCIGGETFLHWPRHSKDIEAAAGRGG
jgi:hypothetical protein